MTTTDTTVQNLIINQLTQAQYESILSPSSTELYLTPDDSADVDLSNVNNTGTSSGASWAMPSNTYEDLTLGASGSEYTALANGWVMFCKRSSGVNQYLNLHNLTSSIFFEASAYANANYLCAFLPVSKGDVFRTTYNAGGSDLVFRFIYAKGSESEAS